jgi:hypothetical protein
VGNVHVGVFFKKWGTFSDLGDFVAKIQKFKSTWLHNAKQP